MSGDFPRTASEWIVRIHADNMSATERAQFARWLAESPANWTEFKAAQKIWSIAQRLETSTVARQELASLSREASAQLPGAWIAPSWAEWLAKWHAFVMGAVVLATIGGLWLTELPPTPDLPMLPNGGAAETAVNQITTYALPDGSTLTVNADSLVRIAFTSKQRQVTLERGEAFFDVRHNAAWPFVVSAGARTVVVTGTKFDIDFGASDKAVEVAVVEGNVKVAPAAALGAASALPTNSLKAGEVILFPEGKPGVPQKMSASHVAAWRARRLYFDQSPLSDVLADVNRYAKKRIIFGDDSLAELKLSGYFRAGDVDAVLFSLRELYKIQVSDGGGVWIRNKPVSNAPSLQPHNPQRS